MKKKVKGRPQHEPTKVSPTKKAKTKIAKPKPSFSTKEIKELLDETGKAINMISQGKHPLVFVMAEFDGEDFVGMHHITNASLAVQKGIFNQLVNDIDESVSTVNGYDCDPCESCGAR